MSLLLICLLAASKPPAIPSHTELCESIVANREKIRTLHVRVVSNRSLPKEDVCSRELYLDADANRWRIDSSQQVSRDKRPCLRARWGLHGSQVSPMATSIATFRETAIWWRSRTTFSGRQSNSVCSRFPTPETRASFPSTVATWALRSKLPASHHDPLLLCRLRPSRARVGPSGHLARNALLASGIGAPLHTGNARRLAYDGGPGMGLFGCTARNAAFPRGFRGVVPSYHFSVETKVARHGPSGLWFPTSTHYQAIIRGKRSQDELAEFHVVSQ